MGTRRSGASSAIRNRFMMSALPIEQGWQLASTPPGACATPQDLAALALQWHEAKVPGTVAESLGEDFENASDYDARDWWYRVVFSAPTGKPNTRYRLRFDGLATLATAWLNGVPILSSRNMFVGRSVDVTALCRDVNQLIVVFRALRPVLAERRPRPRWKTALVENQNLRWIRTTLLGRIPGWTPAIAPVGPWRRIALECLESVALSTLDLQARAEGTTGHLRVHGVLEGQAPERARLSLAGRLYSLTIDGCTVRGELGIRDIPLWWPHTHGTPALLPCALELDVRGETVSFDCGAIGFKKVELDRTEDRVRFRINGVPVFCRGACWTPCDFVSLRSEGEELRRTLTMARDAGVNMLRVGGTMVYESDEFYRLCDELGILVWQDFMFANMDYPVAEAEFRAEIDAEARYQFARLQRHACVAVYCGSSEIAQQAAMLGLPAREWLNDFFAVDLERLCSELHAGIPYFPTTPWGGALPFHVGSGISHYYGVGAYRRPLADVKSARVKFAAECLGFSNVPDAETVSLAFEGSLPPPHHPRWKARVPRDSGAGYDFEDVRDHYLRLLWNVDPVALRSEDPERYYAVSRALSGEVMQRAFSEWRNPASGCGGALVWFFRDFWPGAGWGSGRPKAAFWYLRRAWVSPAVRFTDEGLDGLNLHVINDSADSLAAQVELEMYREGRVRTASARRMVCVPAHGATTLQCDDLLGYFSDSTNAYRFGPPQHDLVLARLSAAGDGKVLSEDFYFPLGLGFAPQSATGVSTSADWHEGKVTVSLRSPVFLQTVSLSAAGFLPDDNYFHLAPNQEKRVVFFPQTAAVSGFEAHVEALNVRERLTVCTARSLSHELG
jgi:beta-mannosidase